MLADLGKDGGFQGWTRNKAIVKSGRWKEWRKALTRFEAFFKHADNDAHATCDFQPEITTLFIVESVELLRILTGKLTWPGLIFSIWFSLAHPELIQEGEFKALLTERAALVNFDINDFNMIVDLLKMHDALPAGTTDNILM